MDDRPNPFAAPQTDISPVVVADELISDAEKIRRQYINHETSIKSIGLLYFLGTAGFAMLAFLLMEKGTPLLGVLVASFGLITGITGYYIRKLQPWTRIPTGIISVLGLINVPVGTLINGYILWLVFSEKGRVVFSPEYSQVIAQTPHVRYKTSKIVVFFLFLLVGVLMLGAIAFLVGRPAGR